MFRYKLRTLLILMAILPPLVWLGWTKYGEWRAEQERQRLLNIAWEWTGAGDINWQAILSLQPAAPPPPADNSTLHQQGPDLDLPFLPNAQPGFQDQ